MSACVATTPESVHFLAKSVMLHLILTKIIHNSTSMTSLGSKVMKGHRKVSLTKNRTPTG